MTSTMSLKMMKVIFEIIKNENYLRLAPVYQGITQSFLTAIPNYINANVSASEETKLRKFISYLFPPLGEFVDLADIYINLHSKLQELEKLGNVYHEFCVLFLKYYNP